MAIQGNLDSALLMAGGKPMLDAAESILAAFKGGRHIFNLGHGVRPETPIVNVERVLEILRGG